jgi:hypothetical protein
MAAKKLFMQGIEQQNSVMVIELSCVGLKSITVRKTFAAQAAVSRWNVITLL